MESSPRSPVATAHRRPRFAAAGFGRLARACASLAAAAVVAWPCAAAAQSGERAGTGPTVDVKSSYAALRYFDFQLGAATCSQGGFSVDATVSTDIVGPFQQSGRTTLDGAPYDTYTLKDDTGPFVDSTNFSRTFAPPPPASSSYEFVFLTTVVQNGAQLGVSRTRIVCEGGVLAASNQWIAAYTPIPVGTPAGVALLAAGLALAGVARLRARRG